MTTTAHRTVLLHGTTTQGSKYIKNFKQDGIVTISNKQDLNEIYRQQSNPLEKNKINSILIVTEPGDDIDELSDFHDIANKLNILVTIIIIIHSKCKLIQNSEQLSKLRKISDMVIFTTDKEYMQYMIECIT